MDGARRQAAGSVFTRPIRRRGRTALCQRGHLFFWLHLLQPYAAFALIVLITALAFFLSQRHNAQVIAAFAMIGGYLPALVFFFSRGYRCRFS